jgi:hypothetical protein
MQNIINSETLNDRTYAENTKNHRCGRGKGKINPLTFALLPFPSLNRKLGA